MEFFEILSRNWKPGIGDPTVMGWVTVVGYFVAAVLLLYKRRLALSLFPSHWKQHRWLLLGFALLMIALGLNKQLDLQTFMTNVGREMAENHLSRMYLDIQRNSWYLRETIEQSGQGRLAELARSKLAYAGIVGDSAIAHKWRSLGDNPDGSWGKAVHQFYVDHSFPFPGEKHGIYELGALHDWVHVLAGYGTEPEGEIDVFAFIAAGMEDPHGFTQFVMTLGLFQNYSIKHVSGKRILTARSDTVDDPASSERLADALRRGSQTTVDTMGGIDHFSLAAENLDELRMRFNIAPKSDVS